MGRIRGIKKHRKQRNRRKSQKTTADIGKESNQSDIAASCNESTHRNIQVSNINQVNNNNDDCNISRIDPRFAGTSNVTDNVMLNDLKDVSSPVADSISFDTPQKSYVSNNYDCHGSDSSTRLCHNEDDHNNNFRSQGTFSRIDRRNCVDSHCSGVHQDTSSSSKRKSSSSNAKFIKRISKFHHPRQVSTMNHPNISDCETENNLQSPAIPNSSPNDNNLTTINDACEDDSSHSNLVRDIQHNHLPLNNNNLFTSYSTRRRYVRNIKQYIFSLGPLNVQSSILVDLLNDSEMKSVIDAAGIKSPKVSNFNEHVVNQVLKQINRSSSKSSYRGRVNDDKQSFKINLTAAMLRSPTSNSSPSIANKNYVSMLFSKTCLSRSSARRLVIKATKHRKKLTNAEKDTTWSIVSQRNNYNTDQKSMNRVLFDWILNHPHVISSPILRDTVLVKVPQADGHVTKERVGKLLLEISVRELYQDLLKPPPIGLSNVYCKESKNVLVSERYLRNFLPPQLKPITFAQKQLCGCECCTVMKLLHTSLIKYRKKLSATHTDLSKTITRSRVNVVDTFKDYNDFLNANDFLLSVDGRDILRTMTCPCSNGDGLIQWKCALNRCDSCLHPIIPPLELSSDVCMGKIKYGTYQFHSKCKIHGILSRNASFCQKCIDDSIHNTNLPEKIVRKKEITLMESSIDDFHKQTYIPMLKQYRYHIALVSILSKNHCRKTRYEAYCQNCNCFFTERDYAERLTRQLDGEIQSDHFGDNPSLSIEGCTLQYHQESSPSGIDNHQKYSLFDFHSHFADYSRQDASTTFEHMCSMFQVHESVNGPIPKNAVILDHTDGCAKQYRSGNALYLLNVICLKYHVIFDRAVGAPGHGKSIIDGLNAVDKHHLKKVMCMSGSTRPDDVNTRMQMHTIVEESSLSFAEECARICGAEDRKFGVMSTQIYPSHSKKLKERFYHVQDPTKIRFGNISKTTKGWLKEKGQTANGIRHHYNFRADPALGLGFIASRRIPCMCVSCVSQLKSAWLPKVDFYKQPRYLPNNEQCQLWNCLGPLNNWRLIQIVDTDPTVSAESSVSTKNVFREALQDRAFAMMSVIEVGNYGAIPTTDPSALSGYYIFCFRSVGYVLQHGISTNSERIPSGELVCEITWLNPVPNSSRLYSHGLKDDESLNSIIRIQHIVNENVKYSFITSRDVLPKHMYPMFASLTAKNTIIIDNDCHDMILEEITAREHLDYEEYFAQTDDDDKSDYCSEDDDNVQY